METRTVRDADDYSNYVEEGEPRYHMMSLYRWETLSARPWRILYKKINQANFLGGYVTWSDCFNARLERCFLFDTLLESCTLRNCHIHYTMRCELSNCVFYDCVLTTESGDHASVVFSDGVYLQNCTLKGNFAQEEGRSDLQTDAKDPAAVQTPPYEVHNNVVLKDCVVNCLRRWVWSHRIKQRDKRRGRYAKYAPKLKWKGKAAGKRPMQLDLSYDVGEQLELPLRRCDWSLEYTEPERLSPPRKRKIEVDLTLDDD